MSFVADHKARRTYDPERGIELIPAGGGSDGTMLFVLRSEEEEVHFRATMSVRQPTESEQKLPEYCKSAEVGVWKISGPIGQQREIAVEAMKAFKVAHGTPEDTPFEAY